MTMRVQAHISQSKTILAEDAVAESNKLILPVLDWQDDSDNEKNETSSSSSNVNTHHIHRKAESTYKYNEDNNKRSAWKHGIKQNFTCIFLVDVSVNESHTLEHDLEHVSRHTPAHSSLRPPTGYCGFSRCMLNSLQLHLDAFIGFLNSVNHCTHFCT